MTNKHADNLIGLCGGYSERHDQILKDAAAEIERLSALTEWQPMETAPDKGIILVAGGHHYHEGRAHIPNHRTLNLYNIVWKEKDGKWCGGFDDEKGEMRIIFYPTRWMPLPPPPKE